MSAMKAWDDKDLLPYINKAIKEFSGDCAQLESAIGMFFLCTRFGWGPMMLIHSRATIKNYESIIGLKIREVANREEKMAKRSIAFVMLKGASDFWKAVRGELPDIRTSKVSKA